MKKIILSIVGVLAVLWVALFVSGQQVLVWEKNDRFLVTFTTTEGKKYSARVREDFKRLTIFQQEMWLADRAKKRGHDITVMDIEVEAKEGWSCTYFNGRRFITKEYSSSRTACPNFRENR